MYFAFYTVDVKINDPPSQAFHAVVPPAAAPSSISPLPDILASAACATLLLLFLTLRILLVLKVLSCPSQGGRI